ncbi:MAG TPA: hypothetical protein VFJ30_15030 [Phycisphaerae bacterium]|nr:hypothetical protein [Phycisphaerae bacterium]
MRFVRLLGPRSFQYVLWRAESSPAPELGEIAIERVGSGDDLSDPQRAFLRRRIRALTLWRLMRWPRAGEGWVFLGRWDGEYCHYSFVTAARRYRKVFPVMEGGRALLIGPCLTDERFRGRSIFPRVLQHIVSTLSGQGVGPFYIHAAPGNHASLRAIEKAGFSRLGTWAGTRWLFDARVRSERVGD